MSENENQVGGTHYKKPYQHWDFVNDLQLGYFPAQVLRYLSRWKEKNGKEDLLKAQHYLAKYEEVLEIRRKMAAHYVSRFVEENNLSQYEAMIVHSVVGGEFPVFVMSGQAEVNYAIDALLTGKDFPPDLREEPASEDPAMPAGGCEWKGGDA